MSRWTDMEKKSSGDIIARELLYTFDDSISPDDLDQMLKQGIVHFQYRKKAPKGQPEDSGAIRDAWGTRKMDMGCIGMPHGGECEPKKSGYIVYWDLEAEDWRVFWPGRLLGVCKKVFTEDEFDKFYPTLDK